MMQLQPNRKNDNLRAATVMTIGGMLLMLTIGALSSTLGVSGEPVLAPQSALPRVLVRTEMGDIIIEVDTVNAPVTGGNFLRYVDAGFYDGGRFFRTVTLGNQPGDSIRIEVIQAGLNPTHRADRFPPIPLERTRDTKIMHLDGTVSMARNKPNSARASFFICIGDQPSLDYGGMRNPDGQGFAAFARVIHGMEVVQSIHRAPAKDQALRPPVRIVVARRIQPGVESQHLQRGTDT